jgi:SAM-dependent methyltransferase
MLTDSPVSSARIDSTTPSGEDPFFYHGQDLEALADLPAYQQWILDNFGSDLHGSVIEVGAGSGNIAARYADQVQRLLLIEPARNLCSQLESRFVDKPHVRCLCGRVEDLSASDFECGGSPFDSALLVNVLEHVKDDAALVSRLGELLRPGGRLLVFVPALPWLFGTLDAHVHHLRRYTRSGLTNLLIDSGFEIERLHFFDLPGVLPWFFAGRVLRQSRFNAGAARFYDRVVVPLARGLERRFKPPIGKNLVCVARRRLEGASVPDPA